MPTAAPLMGALAAALPAATEILAELATIPICPACIDSAGLCIGCAEHDRSLLPQLTEPGWYVDVHSGDYHLKRAKADANEVKESAAAKRARRRNKRKESKRKERRR